MNFLAHLYLSGDSPGIRLGNFIGDFVKGRDLAHFAPAITTGIELHRAIDRFTDSHEVVRESKRRLSPVYRHYSGVIVDIFYDHFLAVDWPTYHPLPLEVFANEVYTMARSFEGELPLRFRRMLPYMIDGDWLTAYATIDGIRRTLFGMSRRTTHTSHMEKATGDLEKFYGDFKSEFVRFFPDLRTFASQWLADSNRVG